MHKMRKYGRADIDYETWYSSWMKQLAINYTRQQLEDSLNGTRSDIKRATNSHLRAIDATGSMTGCSGRRAKTRNIVGAIGDAAIALRGALEIYDLFPEHTAAGVSSGMQVAPADVDGHR